MFNRNGGGVYSGAEIPAKRIQRRLRVASAEPVIRVERYSAMWCLSASGQVVTDVDAATEGVLVTDDAEAEAPHDPNEEGGSHDTPGDLTGNAISAVAAAEISSGVARSPTNHHRRLAFFCVMTAVSIGGMGVASFGVLAGGKVGYAIPKEIFELVVFGTVGVSVAQEATSVQSMPVLFKRAAAWFAIGLFQGSANAFYFISFDAKREGTMWQLEPFSYALVNCFICHIGLVGVAMMRAHHDRRANVIRLYVLLFCAFAFYDCGV